VLNRLKHTAGGYFRKNAEAVAEYATDTAEFNLTPPKPSKVKLLPGDGAKPSSG
jgi:hypothetical protein